MADTKISALTQLTGADSVAASDELELVDKSDTTMDASGTNKRITAADLAQAVHEQVPEVTTTTPAAPAAGVKIFARKRAGRRRLSQVGPSGLDYPFQPGLDSNRASWMLPNGNSTTLSVTGLVATAIGTATTANWSNASLLQSLKRLSYISAATAGSSGGVKHNVLQWWRGNAAGLGGFFLVWRFGFASIPATWRFFVGLYGSTTNPANGDPSALVNLIGVGKDTADTAPQFMHNDGSGTATKSSSALALPAANEVWEMRAFCAPNDTKVDLSIARLNTSNLAEYTATTDLPANTQGLLPILWANNGSTAAAIDPVLVSMYIETDY